MSVRPSPEVRERIARIEALLSALEGSADPGLMSGARELVQGILDLHAAGLARLVQLAAAAGAPGRELLHRFADDGLVASLLALHDLHPLSVGERVEQALAKLEPILQAQDAKVELLDVTDGTVRLRLFCGGHGHGGSGDHLRAILESAIVEAVPDATGLNIERATTCDGRIGLPLVKG